MFLRIKFLLPPLFILGCCSQVIFAKEKSKNTEWREAFNKRRVNDGLPEGWEIKATIPGTTKTKFEIKKKKNDKNILQVKAEKATGALMCKPSNKVDLNKTPILRWRWRVSSLPKNGDSRSKANDDQALAIYIGASDWVLKKSISYRYDNKTPLGSSGDISYGAGVVKVKWFCLRNAESGTKKWFVEERDVAKDFKDAFGFIPKEFILSVCANSQHTKSTTKAMVDYIEFIAKKPLKKEK